MKGIKVTGICGSLGIQKRLIKKLFGYNLFTSDAGRAVGETGMSNIGLINQE